MTQTQGADTKPRRKLIDEDDQGRIIIDPQAAEDFVTQDLPAGIDRGIDKGARLLARGLAALERATRSARESFEEELARQRKGDDPSDTSGPSPTAGQHDGPVSC